MHNTIKPTLEEATAIRNSGLSHYDIIPISLELMSDESTPITLLKKLKRKSAHCFILESSEDKERWGRYTFLGFDPSTEITCINGKLTVKSSSKSSGNSDVDVDVDVIDADVTADADPNICIQQLLDRHKSPKLDYLPPFTGGLVGYFAYDYAKYSEKALRSSNINTEDRELFNDVDLMLFDKVIAFDNFRQKLILIANMRVPVSENDFESEYNNAVSALNGMRELIRNGDVAAPDPPRFNSDFREQFTESEFCSMVLRAKEYIREGDIFQVVLSNCFEADFDGSLLDAYRVLRTINPSPYMFYLSGTDVEIAGASPETLVKLQDGKLFTYPLAGTRPRGGDALEDAALERELLADEKELSEHNMLVDLGRNDLGRISQFGTVNVEKYMEILRFSHVMHIGSTVSGAIRSEFSGLDAVNAVLPAGTLSGAPKIRAMQIISELERRKRGVYGGAIGYLDFTGNMDTCIAIRIAYKKSGKVFVRSGAGVVADSVPESEYRECVNKAKAVITALKESEGGLA